MPTAKSPLSQWAHVITDGGAESMNRQGTETIGTWQRPFRLVSRSISAGVVSPPTLGPFLSSLLFGHSN